MVLLSTKCFILKGFLLCSLAQMSRSAFKAVQDTPIYDANTSDDDEDEDGNENENENQEDDNDNSVQQTPQTISPSPHVSEQKSKFIHSKFIPNDDNLILGQDYIVIGLKVNENLIVKGQFTLEIQRGAISVNDIIYHSSIPALTFLNPPSISIPLISSAQVLDRSKVKDVQTPENEHLFTSDYKSVIKLSNYDNGVTNIGKLNPQFKNFFVGSSNVNDFEYTFSPVFKPDNSISLIDTQNWSEALGSIAKEILGTTQLSKVVIIGNKNSGKSTFLKLLLQHLLTDSLSESASSINIMDLDPGQTDFSKPDCISLNKISSSTRFNDLGMYDFESSKNHYVGFTSPKDQPKRYDMLVHDLISTYNNDGLLQNESLLINTPGWIKGYGLEITKKLINGIKPTHLIYLNSGNFELDGLIVDSSVKIIPILGSFKFINKLKFSPAHLRVLKSLLYHHKHSIDKFDFEPLLAKPPTQISYGTHGIKAITILGTSALNPDDLKEALEATVVGIHLIHCDALKNTALKNLDALPIIDAKEFDQIPSTRIIFISLAIVHSIDETNKLINLYIPEFEKSGLNKPKDYEYLIVRGKTETPIWEITPSIILENFNKNELPYISFSSTDKVWRSRKNVQRRGQMN